MDEDEEEEDGALLDKRPEQKRQVNI